jgi:hypothetical protein
VISVFIWYSARTWNTLISKHYLSCSYWGNVNTLFTLIRIRKKNVTTTLIQYSGILLLGFVWNSLNRFCLFFPFLGQKHVEICVLNESYFFVVVYLDAVSKSLHSGDGRQYECTWHGALKEWQLTWYGRTEAIGHTCHSATLSATHLTWTAGRPWYVRVTHGRPYILLVNGHCLYPSLKTSARNALTLSSTIYRMYLKCLDKLQEWVLHLKTRKSSYKRMSWNYLIEILHTTINTAIM